MSGMAMSSSAMSGRMRDRSSSAARPSCATNTSCPMARNSAARELAASTLSSTTSTRFCTVARPCFPDGAALMRTSCTTSPALSEDRRAWARLSWMAQLLGAADAMRLERRLAHGVAAALDRGLDLARVGRLDEVVVEAGRGGARAIFLLAVAGERDQQHVAGIAALAQLAGDRVAVETGQADVEHHHVRVEHLERGERLQAVVHRLDLVALQPQERRGAFGRVDVVVHHQHAPSVDLGRRPDGCHGARRALR